MATSTYLIIITLNVNELHAPNKRHRVAEWIEKQDPSMCCLHGTHFRAKNTHRLKVKGWTNILHGNGNKKKSVVEILMSDKIDFKTKFITKGKKGQHIMIKGQFKNRI